MTAQPRKSAQPSLADRVKESQGKDDEIKKDDNSSAGVSTHETPVDGDPKVNKTKDEPTHEVTVGGDPTVTTNQAHNDSNIPVGTSDKKNDGLKDETDNDESDENKLALQESTRITLAKDDPRNPPNKHKYGVSEAAQARANKLSPTGPDGNMYSGGSYVEEPAPKEATLLNTPSEIALANKPQEMQFQFAEPLYELDKKVAERDKQSNE